MIEPSSVTQWLTSFRKKNLLKLISLAQKWGFNGHLVIAGSSHHRPRVEDEHAFSCGTGSLCPSVSVSCRSLSPNIPPATFRRTAVLGQSTRGRCGEPSSQQTHIQIAPQRVGSCFGVTIGQSVSVFLQEIVQQVFFPQGFSQGLHFP